MAPPEESEPGGRRFLKPSLDSLWLGVVLLIVYFANGDCLSSGDTLPSSCLPVSLLREGNLSFTPDEAPFMFGWILDPGPGETSVSIRRWDQKVKDRPARELRAEGRLQPDLPRYYLTESAREGEFLGIYGPGPGLVALPVFALGFWAVGDLPESMTAVLWMGRIAASLLVVGSAVFLFLAARPRIGRGPAWVFALLYGLGTCVWSQSSQALWQQTPVLFFFAVAGWAVLREPATAAVALVSGLALGLAVVCRSTSAVVLVAVAWGWARKSSALAGFFGLGLIPSAAVVALYGALYLESPFGFTHSEAHAGFALSKTGDMDLWQTPLWTGAAGILVSPARGLLVYSPFFLFAGWGAWVAWKDPAYRPLRGIALAVAGVLLLYFRWFDWWGGHSFGYRLIVDTTPLLMLLLLPVALKIRSLPALRATFLTLAAWSTLVQALGAFAYEQGGWNAKASGWEVRLRGESKPRVVATRQEADTLAAERQGKVLGRHELDVDRAEHRHRLWSVTDNPIAYYALHFGESRAAKRARLRAFLAPP